MSNLASKLSSLRRQSGVALQDAEVNAVGVESEATPALCADALRRRLQQAGRRRGSAPRASADEQALAARLGGERICEGVIAIREQFPGDAAHGAFPLLNPLPQHAPSLCTGATAPRPRVCVFMDTETTGLAGGTGTLVFLLGMARFSQGRLQLLQLLITGFQGERAMLEEARTFLHRADALVTFNGRSFDSPLLAARYRLSGLCDPFAELQHVDLLHPTRRAFKHRWPDCRLQTVERRLLGVERVDDLPGWQAPQAWFDWVRHGRHEALSGVCAHNRLDLLSLAVLPAALQRSHDDPLASGANVLAWAKHQARNDAGGGSERTSFAYLQRHRAGLDVGGCLELARLARRRGDWALAVEVWETLAEDGECAAIEHLAKYFEHQQRDYARALEATARLLSVAPCEPRYIRRDARLRARLAGMPR